jgi:hypothetical protein
MKMDESLFAIAEKVNKNLHSIQRIFIISGFFCANVKIKTILYPNGCGELLPSIFTYGKIFLHLSSC